VNFPLALQQRGQRANARQIREVGLEHLERTGELALQFPGFGCRSVIDPDDSRALAD
jgi:hypothetical protein